MAKQNFPDCQLTRGEGQNNADKALLGADGRTIALFVIAWGLVLCVYGGSSFLGSERGKHGPIQPSAAADLRETSVLARRLGGQQGQEGSPLPLRGSLEAFAKRAFPSDNPRTVSSSSLLGKGPKEPKRAQKSPIKRAEKGRFRSCFSLLLEGEAATTRL